MSAVEILTSKQAVIAILVTCALIAGIVLALVGMFMSHRARMRAAELEAEARNAMLSKGFSSEEIANVLRASQFTDQNDKPQNLYLEGGIAPCDVVALDPDEEWNRALLLAVSPDGSSFLVHFVGREISENAWVNRSLIRFPASLAFDEAAHDPSREFPFAIPATVASGESWYPAYLVTRRDRSFVYYVEADWSENEWVDESRIRYESPYGVQSSPKPSKQVLDL